MLTGRRPEGLTSPNRIEAIALPPCSPGYHAVSKALATSAARFISSGRPSIYTITSGLPVFATASISCSCLPKSDRVARSKPSPHSMSESVLLSSTVAAPVAIYFVLKSRALDPPTTSTTASAPSAARTAAGMSADVVSRMAHPRSYTTSTLFPATSRMPSSTVLISSRACGAV